MDSFSSYTKFDAKLEKNLRFVVDLEKNTKEIEENKLHNRRWTSCPSGS